MLKELRCFVAREWNHSKRRVDRNKKRHDPTVKQEQGRDETHTTVALQKSQQDKLVSHEEPPDLELGTNLNVLNNSTSSLSIDESLADRAAQKPKRRSKATRRSSDVSNSSKKTDIYLPRNEPRSSSTSKKNGPSLSDVMNEKSGKSHGSRRSTTSKKKIKIRDKEKASFPKDLQDSLNDSVDLQEMFNMSRLTDSSGGEDSSRVAFDNSVSSHVSTSSKHTDSKRKKKRRSSKKSTPKTLPGELDELYQPKTKS
jgi:hypothetical protein